MHERIHGAAPPDAPPAPAPSPSSPPTSPASRIKPCWVTDRHGRLPGLLLQWRQTASGWQGRVVRPVLEGGAWIVVEDWLPATLLEPGS
jgi:hypothetical protein